MEMLIVVAILYATELFYCMFLIYADANGNWAKIRNQDNDDRNKRCKTSSSLQYVN